MRRLLFIEIHLYYFSTSCHVDLLWQNYLNVYLKDILHIQELQILKPRFKTVDLYT
jgi:hypothetical protein